MRGANNSTGLQKPDAVLQEIETPLLNSLPPELKMPFHLFWMRRTGEASDCLLCLENACQSKR
jgi:hypothetical protein